MKLNAPVSFIQICKTNLDALCIEHEKNIDEISSLKSRLNNLDAVNLEKITEIENQKIKLISTIEDCVKLGSEVPAKLEDRKKALDLLIEDTKSNFKKSSEFIEINDKIISLKNKNTKIDDLINLWREKYTFAESIFGLVDVFCSDKSYPDYNLLFKLNLQNEKLGINTELVNVFESLDEVIELYFASASVEILVSFEGVVREIKINTVLGDLVIPIKNSKISYINLSPESLRWVSQYYDYKLYNNGEDLDSFSLLFSEVENGYKLIITPKSLNHKKLFSELRFYTTKDKEFYDINRQPVLLHPVEELELETEISIRKRQSDFRYSNFNEHNAIRVCKTELRKSLEQYKVKDAEYFFRKLSNKDKPAISVEISSLFNDFRSIINKVSIDSDVIREKVETIISKLSFDKLFFEKSELRLSTNEIENEVGVYWRSFVNSPRDNKISNIGSLRMLKHLCMRGIESPDMCSLGYKGHYKFHVRTRDHTWIIGEIFCPPFALSRKTPIQANEIIFNNESVKVGDAIIRVITER